MLLTESNLLVPRSCTQDPKLARAHLAASSCLHQMHHHLAETCRPFAWDSLPPIYTQPCGNLSLRKQQDGAFTADSSSTSSTSSQEQLRLS